MRGDYENLYIALSPKMRAGLVAHKQRTGVGPHKLHTLLKDCPPDLKPGAIWNWLIGNTKQVRLKHYELVLRFWKRLPSIVELSAEMVEALKAEKDRTGVSPYELHGMLAACPPDLKRGTIVRWMSGKRKQVPLDYYKLVLITWKRLPSDPKNKGYVPLSVDMVAELQAERERTGIGPYRLHALLEDCPPDLKQKAIAHWLKGSRKKVRLKHYELVLNTWKRLPPEADEYVTLSPEIIAELLLHKKRSGASIRTLLTDSGPLPHGLTTRGLEKWFYKKRRPKRVPREHYEFVLRSLKRLPTNPFVPLTEDILKELKAYRERSSLGPIALLSRCPDAPEDLSCQTIENWFSRNVKRARKRHLDYVRRKWADMPARPKHVPVTDDVRQDLHRLHNASGIGPQALLRGATDKPDGLNASMILRWMNGKRKKTTAPITHLIYVLERWEVAGRKVPLTEVMIEELRFLMEKTGMGVQALFREARNRPPRLSNAMVNGWFSGKTRRVQLEHYEYVLNRLRRLESEGIRNTRVPFTPEMLNALKRERKRTGISTTRLLSYSEDPPEGLTAAMITNWLMGVSRFVKREHYEFVLDLWKKLPEVNPHHESVSDTDTTMPDLLLKEIPPPRTRKPAGRIPVYAGVPYAEITDELYQHFHSEIRRTRVSPKQLLQSCTDCPKGLTPSLVSNWLHGKTLSAERRYLDYLYRQYELLPDSCLAD